MGARAAFLLLGSVAACAPDPPRFESVLELSDTFDPVGPYPVEAWIHSDLGVERVVLRVTDDPDRGLYGEIRCDLVEGDAVRGRWRGELPGRPAPSALSYYLVATDLIVQSALYPPQAPGELLELRIRSAD